MDRVTSHQGESSAAQTDGPVVLGYYSADHAAVLPPEKVNYAALTHIAYAFASLESNGEVVPFKPEILKMIAYYAHQQNTKVLLSVGGWEHSKHFSTVVADDDWRSTFINSCTSMITEYDLDGIDLDWEFPGREGKAGNIFNPKDDVPNLLLALNEMRQAFDSVAHNKLITMAVTHDKLDGRGSIMAAFDRLVDFFNIMAYNSFGPWCDTTGPVAPTTNCKYTHLTAENAIDNWLHAGVPANKLVLGIPFYGYGSHVRENSYSGKIISPKQQLHSADDEKTWIGLRTNDILTGPKTAKKPWTRNWDDASQTPWLYNSETGGFITYEDPISLKAKVDLAKSKGLRGVMVWALHHDNGELLPTLQSMRK
ncbi:hypothetical protein H4R35_006349 [Dimargaris xerosporica]|nr:hypothetical protein H4R35_006349 [Dimargaris xerosporica]